MTRAEEAALKAYPPEMIYGESTLDGKYDGNATPRYYYIKAYEQVEKDLALTWKDMEIIDSIFREVRNEFWAADRKHSSQVYQELCEEVLSRFNEEKDK